MHPPSAVCRDLARVPRAKLRLAWQGERKQFAIVQLTHVSEHKRGNTYWDEWDYAYGPIFNKRGGTSPDWDPVFWKPHYMSLAEDFDCGHADVMNGRIVYECRDAIYATLEKRKAAVRRQANRDLNSRLEDMVDRQTEDLWELATDSDATSIDVPWEFARDDVARMKRKQDINEEYFSHYHDQPGVKT